MKKTSPGGRREYDRKPWTGGGVSMGDGRERCRGTWVTITYDDGTTASGHVLPGQLRGGAGSDYGIARWLPAWRGVEYIPVDIETGEPLP